MPVICLPVLLDAPAVRTLAEALRNCAHQPALRDAGVAETVRAAATIVQQHKPDVIVAGFAPDDATGAGLLGALHTAAPDAQIIFYVQQCSDAAAASALRAGAFDVIQAPAPERLAAAIDRAIDRAAMRRYLEQAQRDLVGAHHAEFLPMMMDALAHDLRNMLQPLTYSAQILKRSADAGMQSLQESLEGSTQRGLDVVAAMLAFGSDRSRGRGVMDVQELIRTVRLLLPTSLARRVAISCDSPLVTVRCGPHQIELEQCLLALARRALRHLPNGSKLAIRVERREEAGKPFVCFGVEASGAGPAWPPAADNRELLLCRVLAARHGGSVRVDQTSSGKESIEVLLPQLERARSGEAGERRVLIAADDETAPALMEAGVAAGFKVAPVANSGAAEEYLLGASMPEFAIIDADLSQLEGARVFSLLRARGFSGRMVLLTSPGSELGLNSADESVFYMTKPAHGDRIFGVLDDENLTSHASPKADGVVA